MLKDLRDPQKIGEWLLRGKEGIKRRKGTIRRRADALATRSFPDYPKDETLVTETVRQYKEDLQGRDDIYAKSALKSLEKEGKVIGFEPEID